MAQHELAVLLEMLAVAQHLGRAPQQRRERRLALDQRRRAQIRAVEIEEVEGAEDQPVRPAGAKVGLQRREIGGAARPLDDHLAVDDRLLRGSPASASAIALPNRSVQSRPLRVKSVALPSRRCACRR